MAKLTVKFTLPSDTGTDRFGIAIADNPADAVINANAENFLYVKKGFSPSQNIIEDIFELADGEDLFNETLYSVIINPGDSLNNFVNDFTSDDVVSARANADAKIKLTFTMPSDIDADKAGIAISLTEAGVISDANAERFVFIEYGLTPNQQVTLDLFEEEDGTDVVKDVTYFIIVNPGDSLDNFRSDLNSSDVRSIKAKTILQIIKSIADNFEAILVDLLGGDTNITDNLKVKPNGNFPIHPTGFNPVGNTFPQITYKFDEGPSEDAIPAARRVLRIFYWVNQNDKNAYSRMKSTTDRINFIVNRTAGNFQNIDINANSGVRSAGNVKTGGGYDYDADLNKHVWELIYDIVISEDESFLVADAGNATWT